jgi:hypothetical protein
VEVRWGMDRRPTRDLKTSTGTKPPLVFRFRGHNQQVVTSVSLVTVLLTVGEPKMPAREPSTTTLTHTPFPPPSLMKYRRLWCLLRECVSEQSPASEN